MVNLLNISLPYIYDTCNPDKWKMDTKMIPIKKKAQMKQRADWATRVRQTEQSNLRHMPLYGCNISNVGDQICWVNESFEHGAE